MIEIIGHRGASFDAPENTLASIKEAFKQEADGVEVDVRLTRDFQVICMHDSNALRTGKKDMEISQATEKEIRNINVAKYMKEWPKKEKAPSIKEVIELCRGKKLFIEIKTGIEIIDPLEEILNIEINRKEDISIISFNEEVIKIVKSRFPWIKTNFLISIDHLSDSDLNALPRKVLSMDVDGIGVQNHRKFNNKFINSFNGNIDIHVWTVDNPKEARKYREMGLKSITTNVPKTIRAYS
mgnify:CR=1 FL=1|tara:strand:- start:10619 stop:11338 length:720 start_codon:yes stop_codon:yes gene_type:complete